MTRPHTGRWLEELTPGTVIQHAIRRTITESDNVMFTSMTMNPAWLHLNFFGTPHRSHHLAGEGDFPASEPTG